MIQISEYVGEGHPDKLADTLAERIVSSVMKGQRCRISVDVLITQGMVAIAGEITEGVKYRPKEYKDWDINKAIKRITQVFLKDQGYNPKEFNICVKIREQSKEIVSYSRGGLSSGDQSVVYGYACRSKLGTNSYMPESWELSREIINSLKQFPWARRDAKCLVVLDKTLSILTIEEIVISVHHTEEVGLEIIREEVINKVLQPLFHKYGLKGYDRKKFHINKYGKFTVGGLAADSGATNRKLVADSYGCVATHGGGGYSGKDLTKVDRLGAYFARYICKNIVAAGVCEELELGLWFRPGGDDYGFHINKLNGRVQGDEFLSRRIDIIIRELFSFPFSYIHSMFCDIEKGFHFMEVSNGGHFGKDEEDFERYAIKWEQTNMVDKVKDFVKILEAREKTLQDSAQVQKELEENPEQFWGAFDCPELDISE